MLNKLQKVIQFCKQHAIPLILILPALCIGIAGDTLIIPMRYDREAILSGELWRLITGNLAHLGWSHLLMNLASLILIWMLFGKALSTLTWAVIALVSSLFVTIGILLFSPMTGWYVGLSGMLHGLFIAGIFANLAQGYKLEYLLLIAIIAKLFWEQWYGPLPGSESFAGGRVIVNSHLYGAVAGLIAGIFILKTRAK
ncbi:MAG: rhombosortase [Gammaproteobacteria bacterium]|nr:rhombosortase [Gammaproteobacteria bacterium]